MCGIAGVFARGDGLLTDVSAIGVLTEMKHRGPDSLGALGFDPAEGLVERYREEDLPRLEMRKGSLYLFFRRLSIIDLAEHASQPMSSDGGRFQIIFNGEIYNYVELRKELESEGCRFRTKSDTEVLLNAFATWGPACLNRLVGMFGFAVLDTQERKLFLARDPFGIKPLYFSQANGRFAFGSEIKSVLRLTQGPRSANPALLFDYLRFGHTDHHHDTLFQGVYQLPAAHFLAVDLSHSEVCVPERYWAVRYRGDARLSFADAAVQLRELFFKSVKLHLRSDVPIGIALSGGVDSSSIALAVSKLNDSNAEIHAFGYVADEPGISEARWIDLAAEAAGARVHRIEPEVGGVVSDLRDLIRFQDEPVSTSSVYAQYCVFKKVHETGIKVMLDGQGADELLGGYHYFLSARLASMLRQRRLGEALTFLREATQLPGTGYRSLLMSTADRLVHGGLRSWLRERAGRDLVPKWLDRGWLLNHGALKSLDRERSSVSSFGESLVQGLTHESLPHLLRYEDRNSMAFSVESRVPFLTTELAEFVYSLPEDYLISRNGTTKAVFREAMRGLVPDPILDRRDKIGFWTPEKRWVSELSAWVDELLASPTAAQIPALQLNEVRKSWAAIREERAPFDARVWRWINLIEWTRTMRVQY